MVKIIAVIPARGGSKGIPRKNLRLLDGKPLIAYSIEAAQCSKNIDKVVVSTEDAEIKEFARLYGAEVVERPPELSDDEITLDPVIKQAVQNYEDYDYIVTIQPTSPLLSSKTLDSAISEMKKSSCDTLISVVDETHLYWTNRGTGPEPIYRKRENRQYLDPIYKETGALMISKRGAVIEGSRIGKDVRLFEIPRGEGIDIDNYSDWIVA
jgi:CMP-N-acetylneuraminic acid synthetase